MDFSFTEDQTMLRDALAGYLADTYGFDARRAAIGSETGRAPGFWAGLGADLGLLGATVPEALGGLGGGAVETMVIMEELGRALVAEPYLDTVVIGAGLLARTGHPRAAELIAGVIEGRTTFAFAYGEPQARYTWRDLKTTARRSGAGFRLDGRKAVVAGAPWASHLIVTARTGGAQRDREGMSLFLVEAGAGGIERRDYPTVDGWRASEIVFDDVALPADALIGEEGAAFPLIEQAMDEATAAICAEAVGVMRRLHEGTLDYTKERRQFGQPIAQFQVLQHRMVDMFIQLEQAISMTYMATLKLGEPPAQRAKAVSAAKVQVGRACRFVGQGAIQLHGAMGITEEMPISHYFKRATVLEGLYGSVDHHLRRYMAL